MHNMLWNTNKQQQFAACALPNLPKQLSYIKFFKYLHNTEKGRLNISQTQQLYIIFNTARKVGQSQQENEESNHLKRDMIMNQLFVDS